MRMGGDYVQSWRKIVVDVDLEEFVGLLNRDILIKRLGKRMEDAGVIRLIRTYLNAGILATRTCASG